MANYEQIPFHCYPVWPILAGMEAQGRILWRKRYSIKLRAEPSNKYFPDQIIASNIDPKIVAKGHLDDVYNACRQAMAAGKKCSGGYVLMGGCELPPSTPPYHIYLMQKARNDFGSYD